MRHVVTLTEYSAKFLALISAACGALLVMAVGTDVALRLVAGRSIRGVIEFSESLMVGMVFMGLAYAELSEAHVRVRLVTRKLPLRLRTFIRSLSLTMAAGLVLWMVYATGQRALTSYVVAEYRAGLLRFPLWPARSLVTLGLFALFMQLFVKSLSGWLYAATGKGDPPGIAPEYDAGSNL